MPQASRKHREAEGEPDTRQSRRRAGNEVRFCPAAEPRGKMDQKGGRSV